jgi:hypothetical protein
MNNTEKGIPLLNVENKKEIKQGRGRAGANKRNK